MLTVWAPSNVVFNLTIGIVLLFLQTGMTYFVVNRIISRNESRRRKSESSVIEARLLDASDGLLSDGLPVAVRSIEPVDVLVGDAKLTRYVGSVDFIKLTELVEQETSMVISGLMKGLTRYGLKLASDSNFAILDSSLTPMLIRLLTSIDTYKERVDEWIHTKSNECEADLRREAVAVTMAAWDLHEKISDRWA